MDGTVLSKTEVRRSDEQKGGNVRGIYFPIKRPHKARRKSVGGRIRGPELCLQKDPKKKRRGPHESGLGGKRRNGLGI